LEDATPIVANLLRAARLSAALAKKRWVSPAELRLSGSHADERYERTAGAYTLQIATC
jgi:hypothetical protein